MPLEDEVDGGSNAAENDQSTITESNLAATKPIGANEMEEQIPNGKSTTEDSNNAVAETILTESNTLLDSVDISEPFEETDVLEESIYITETEDITDDIETIDLVIPDSTAAGEVAVTPDTKVAVTPDTEVAVTPDTEVAVTPDTEVAVTLDTEVAVIPDTEVAVTLDREVAVTLDTEVAVTSDTEVAVTTDTVVTADTERAVTPETEDNATPDTEAAVTPDTEVVVTPETPEPSIEMSDEVELMTLSKSVGETEPMYQETENETTLVTEEELVGMEGSDIQDTFMETKDEIVDDLEFIRGKLATPPILMEDVMKEPEVTKDATINHASFNPDSCGQDVLEKRAPLQRVFDYLSQYLLPSLLLLLKSTASFIFSFSEALASLLDTFFTRAMPKVKAD